MPPDTATPPYACELDERATPDIPACASTYDTRPEQSKEFGPVAPHTYGFPSAEYARDTVLPDT